MSAYTHKRSSVFGGSWSTPFGTPFFIRWGEWSLKVPMAQLREEYDAWEKLQRRPKSEPPKPAPIPCLPSGSFDWAEDVEQELFSGTSNNFDNTGINLDSKLDTDRVFSLIVDQVVPEGVAVVGAGTTLCAALEEVEEEYVTGEDKAVDLDSIDLTDTDTDSTPLGDSTPSNTSTPSDDSTSPNDPTHLDDPIPSTNIDNTVYRIINISTTGTDFSLHMVEDDTGSNRGTSAPTTTTTTTTTTAQELYEAIQFLGTVGLLNLDTYATVFDTAARACAAGSPFWLNDPLGDREIVV